EEGELEFFIVNAIACLLQLLRHVLRGTIVAGRAGGSVAATHRGDVLQRPQVPEGALACRRVDHLGSKGATDIVLRPRDTAWRDCSKQRDGEANTPACAKSL